MEINKTNEVWEDKMRSQAYKYQVIVNGIYIVDRFAIGSNVFNTLKEAKDDACDNLIGVNEAEHAAYKERIRLITKEELFDELFHVQSNPGERSL
jgi:hypothetical protein